MTKKRRNDCLSALFWLILKFNFVLELVLHVFLVVNKYLVEEHRINGKFYLIVILKDFKSLNFT